jgi:methylase of polypeptide subunit release factors
MPITRHAATATLRDLGSADAALVALGDALRADGYRFTTITPATHERVNRRAGNRRARDVRDVFGWSRPFGPGVLPDHLVTLMDAAGVLERSGGAWHSLVRFSSYDEQIFVHSAYPTTAEDSVFFGPDTYRMTDAATAVLESRELPVRRAVDIGCGTGAGAIAVARRRPGAEVLAVDINPAALRFARLNAVLAGTPNVRPCHSDLLGAVDGTFDLIISNPPFMIDPAGRHYRHGGPHGHDLPLRIIDAAAGRLAPGGTLVLFSGTGIAEGRDPFRAALGEHLDGTGLTWSYREVDPDVYGEELDGPAYAHAERIALVLLTATRDGGRGRW